jgi:tetratricopeptide (TPR) repeat protein
MKTTQRSNEGTLRLRRRAVGAIALAAALVMAACGPGRNGERYEAEKQLFKARKLAHDLYAGGMRREFLSKTADAYRAIVRDHAASADSVAGIEKIVVAAQMELAELEYRGGLLRESRDDFEAALAIAGNVPAACANALYSAGVISEELGDDAQASRCYERFVDRFLAPDSIESTARMNPRYLVAPLKLASLADRRGDREGARRWLEDSERVLSSVIERGKNPALLREARYDLLATYLQEKNWTRGLALANELAGLYRNSPADLSAVLYLKAKITEEGLGDHAAAIALYRSIADDYPKNREAPDALLAAAAIERSAGRLDEAAALYRRVVTEHTDRGSAVVEAQWRLAGIEESTGDIEAAALRYRSIYSDFPETLQGFEAPLRIARMYGARGAADAARAARGAALEHYETLLDGERSAATKILAEQYVIRTLTDDGRWKEAAERLTAIPDRYPDYVPFRENYMKAAAMYERELHDRGRAIETLEACAAKYPGTDLAAAARKELTRLER